MAIKTKKQSNRGAARSGGRITGGRAGRGRGGGSTPGGPMGMLNQITGRLGRSTGRRKNKGGGSLASKASGFVSGFLSGGGKSGRRRR